MDLKNARIVGFFSLPSPYLAEHNPAGYANALANCPRGAGSCFHCGTGILHHVVVKDTEGNTRFIGSTCAERVGLDKECLRYRMTSEEIKARRDKRNAYFDAEARRRNAWNDLWDTYLAARFEDIGDIVEMLEKLDTDFHRSLAEQLRRSKLSPNQAYYVAKATSATGRRNKKNAEAWDAVVERCTAPDPREPNHWKFKEDYALTLAAEKEGASR